MGKYYQPNIVFEDGVSLQRCHIIAGDSLIIGKNSTISFDVMITNIEHEYQNVEAPIIRQPLNVKKTVIGENCFIGCGAKIQAGTILGKHCIVGANSVVRGKFPDYCVIAGVPAKVVKCYSSLLKVWQRVDSNVSF